MYLKSHLERPDPQERLLLILPLTIFMTSILLLNLLHSIINTHTAYDAFFLCFRFIFLNFYTSLLFVFQIYSLLLSPPGFMIMTIPLFSRLLSCLMTYIFMPTLPFSSAPIRFVSFM